MKKIYLLYIVLISLATTSLIGCSDWTESEAKTFPESIVSDEYYAALRAYKQTDHQVAFGWFGGWSGEGAYMKSSLAGILFGEIGRTLQKLKKKIWNFANKLKVLVLPCVLLSEV